jgi:NADH-quinone oxidoreductase subunit I
MSGGVIEVRKSKGLAFLERSWLAAVLRSAAVSGRHFLHGLRGRGVAERVGIGDPGIADREHDRPSARRGFPVLVADSEGHPLCSGCGLCVVICPTDCIRLNLPPGGEAVAPSRGEDFELDVAGCLFCGLCEEVCPLDAIAMGPLAGISHFERKGLVLDLHSLLVPASLLRGTLGEAEAGADSGVDSDAGESRLEEADHEDA